MKKISILAGVILPLVSATLIMAGDRGIGQGFLTKNPFEYGSLLSSSVLTFLPDGTYTYEYGSGE
ncbi:MAG TPA: hypothetical protein PKN50_03975 [Spirochaetota bacterium]|nr:hypothetical protein [Spirochaetota bacterium]HPV40952.1 hypothetical protein [Spirochaetota bacterium]